MERWMSMHHHHNEERKVNQVSNVGKVVKWEGVMEELFEVKVSLYSMKTSEG